MVTMSHLQVDSSEANNPRRWLAVGVGLAAAFVVGIIAEGRWGWVEPAFDAVAHMFFEVSMLARIRHPSQVALVRGHLLVVGSLMIAAAFASGFVTPHFRRFAWILVLGYIVRAAAWTIGGNLPLIPGDSCHYLEVAQSVYRGEGPVKHYVESFFSDYRAIREDRGILDDWATPLHAYVLAGAYRLTGVEPGVELERTVGVAKGVSLLFSFLALPAIYGFGRRRFDRDVGLGAMAILAVFPAHVIYAGFTIRESGVAFTSILAVWGLTEVWSAKGTSNAVLIAILAGFLAGLAILARNTALALMAGAGLFGLVRHFRRSLGPLLLWGVVMLVVIAPWAWVTYQEYGQPFYSYTNYFQYNFSWAVHHYEKGITRAGDFYTAANAPEIIRVKIKSLAIIAVTSTMILGLPAMLGFMKRLRHGTETDRLIGVIALVFVLATLANIADVTQVAQLGRYYLPVFVLALPTAFAAFRDWSTSWKLPRPAGVVLGLSFVALLWADPTWAYDAGWYGKPYQLHWPAIREAGDWIKAHPEAVPLKSRVMTWFPWEVRIAGDRPTVLLPRNFQATRIEEVIRQYGVTHVLWGSFESPEHLDPVTWGPYMERLRLSLGLTDAKEIHASPKDLLYPVRLYRVR